MGCVSSAPDSYVLQYAQGTNTRPEDTSWVASRVTSNPDGAWSEASFRWGAVLGRGKFGEVQLVKAEKDQLYYAVKSIPKEVRRIIFSIQYAASLNRYRPPNALRLRSYGNGRARFRFKQNSTRSPTFRALAHSSATVSAPSKMIRASAF